MLGKVSHTALLFELAAAYSSSLDSCQEFAAKWSGSCGGTDDASVYATADWETTGAGATVSSCSTQQDNDGNDIEVLAPNSGSTVSSYSIFARNCVTCSQATSSDPVYIRIQSNNMPKFCYATPTTSSNYPQTGKFDVEMRWNPNVLNVKNVADSAAETSESTDTLLCDGSFTADSSLPSSSEFKSDLSTSDTTKVVGWSIDNVQIYSGLNSGTKDALETLSSQMDMCLTYS